MEFSNPHGTGRSAAVRVTEEVAEREGTDPLDLEPLYEAVDPDALDAFCRTGGPDASVTFAYLGYRVTVDGTGEVDVTDPEDGTDVYR